MDIAMGFSRLDWVLIFLVPLLQLSDGLLHKEQTQITNNTHFDYIILGGGTAGIVVASRLSEDPHITVAVIEAGDFERNNPNVTTITELGVAQKTRVDWQYESAPLIFADNQSLEWSAGKGLGGSSLINGMTYIRPASSQMDLWPSIGLELDWAKLFAFSKKGEHFQPPSASLTALGASYQPFDHDFRGPLKTCISPLMTSGIIHDILNSTFKNLGIPPRHEFDGGELRGFGTQACTQDSVAEVREDAARAYYYPVMDRQNLVIMVNTTATRILWSPENPEGIAIASAAEVSSQNGDVSTIYANREIILSAGAFRSPAILENSGIGNPSVLSQQSIDVKVDLPSVGENFQDQTVLSVSAEITQNFTGFPPFVAHISLHDLFGSNTSSIFNSTLAKIPGYAATIAAQNGGASNASVQQHLLETQLYLLLKSNTPAVEIAPIVLNNLIFPVFWPLQPFSRGSVHINSTNRTKQPLIDPKFFQFDFDGQMAVATTKYARNFLTTAPLSGIVNASTITPSFELVPEDASDEVWLDWIKTKSSFQPNFHHLGTCAMLPKTSGGVVDNDFKVYGTGNVRVVDLSIVPLQVAGHSTSLLYGIAEWASEKIKRDGRNITVV
ncbi:alcohol oxidase [Mollisia scopiformis]|uniref:Alcohol oxidase n=1 Tax=Mollisia scopiformis TaxID=149040 RepID=A0A194X0P6_MOLSC|nr:alcohol oxidase [Mollisia scopiformis]KUJ13773.1 alcohol oxidase [Mollisia scopiformis]